MHQELEMIPHDQAQEGLPNVEIEVQNENAGQNPIPPQPAQDAGNPARKPDQAASSKAPLVIGLAIGVVVLGGYCLYSASKSGKGYSEPAPVETELQLNHTPVVRTDTVSTDEAGDAASPKPSKKTKAEGSPKPTLPEKICGAATCYLSSEWVAYDVVVASRNKFAVGTETHPPGKSNTALVAVLEAFDEADLADPPSNDPSYCPYEEYNILKPDELSTHGESSRKLKRMVKELSKTERAVLGIIVKKMYEERNA